VHEATYRLVRLEELRELFREAQSGPDGSKVAWASSFE